MSDFKSSTSSGPGLRFNPSKIEDLILSITDKFNFRVVMSDRRVKNAVLVTTGSSIAYYGGMTGAFVGGAVGGVCGVGVVEQTCCATHYSCLSVESNCRWSFHGMSDIRVKNAVLVTTGSSAAYYAGTTGAVVGGAVGGVCGVGLVAVTMREIWHEIKGKLPELYEKVYNYLAGLGFDNYRRTIKFVFKHSAATTQLGMLILQIISHTLGIQILSSLTAA